MILELFAVLLVVSFFLIYLGFEYEDGMYTTIGFFFIFLLSLVLINNSLTYHTGSSIQTLNSSMTVVTNNYTTYSDTSSHWIGYFLAVASSIGMILSFMYPNGKKINR